MKRTKTGLGAKFAVAMAALLLGAASAKAASAVITWGNANGMPNPLTCGCRLAATSVLNPTSGSGTFKHEVISPGKLPPQQAIYCSLNADENNLVGETYFPSVSETASAITSDAADTRLTVNAVSLALLSKTRARTYSGTLAVPSRESIWGDVSVAGCFVNVEIMAQLPSQDSGGEFNSTPA